MEITSVQQNDVTVVSVMDDLDSATSVEATAYLDAEIDRGHTNLVIDLGGVAYLSSAGLRVILDAMRKTRRSGGDVRLAGARGNIRRVVDLAGLAQFTQTFPTVQEAVASYSL